MKKSILALLLGLACLAGAFAEDEDQPPPKKGLEPDPVVLEVSKDRAGELLDALEAAEDERDVNALVGALEPFITAAHEDFEKPLTKLASHRSEAVRVAVVKALGSQPQSKKLGPTLLKILLSRQNKDTPSVAATAIDSLRRLKYEHKKVGDELEDIWRKRETADLMRAAARYFGDLKMVGAVKLLVEWVEAPQPGNVNSGTNPPASYWKRMWETWDEIKFVVQWSLKNITGQEFSTESSWRAWFRSREAQELGIR